MNRIPCSTTPSLSIIVAQTQPTNTKPPPTRLRLPWVQSRIMSNTAAQPIEPPKGQPIIKDRSRLISKLCPVSHSPEATVYSIGPYLRDEGLHSSADPVCSQSRAASCSFIGHVLWTSSLRNFISATIPTPNQLEWEQYSHGQNPPPQQGSSALQKLLLQSPGPSTHHIPVHLLFHSTVLRPA